MKRAWCLSFFPFSFVEIPRLKNKHTSAVARVARTLQMHDGLCIPCSRVQRGNLPETVSVKGRAGMGELKFIFKK
jgi:hypothetical protein